MADDPFHFQELEARTREVQRALQTAEQRHATQMLLPWALGTAEPVGVDRAKWAVTLRQSVRQLFPVS